MQSPYNGVFLKSELAALLCNQVLQLTLDVYKPVFLRCNKDVDIMIACMEAVPSQFSEEVYEKYTRQICNRNRDFKSLVCSVIKQMASERHEKDGYTVVVEGTEDVIGKVFVKRFLIAMASSNSVRSGRFFDPNHTVECTMVTQSNARDCLWGIADEFIRIEKREDDSEVSSVAPSRSRKKHHRRKHRKAPSEGSDASYDSECTSVSIHNHDKPGAPTDVDAWGEVDDDVNPMDSVSQVFAATDNRSHISTRSEVKMSPPIYTQLTVPQPYNPPSVQPYEAPPNPPPPPPPPPPPQQHYR